MLVISVCFILLSLFLMMICLIKEKIIIARIMCVNCFTSYVVALIAILADKIDHFYLDLAIIYALISFIFTSFLLKKKTNMVEK